MKVAISGSGGYIASKLIEMLAHSNYTIIRIQREHLRDVTTLVSIIDGTDVVINLAGAPIFRRWTKKHKEEILERRVQSTKNIVKAINQLVYEKRPKLLISASAIGIYKPGLIHTESIYSLDDSFVSNIVLNWENATSDLSPDVRKVIFRIGLVLGKDSKTIQNLLPVFKLGLGGKLGSGKQPFPFIDINDAVRGILWSIRNEKAKGIYNLVSPQHITNEEFTKALAKAVKRPAIFAVPSVILQLLLGERSTLLLKNPIVYPENLINQGFVYLYSDIEMCLNQIITNVD
mgnify:CR=1 FL=1